MLKRIWQKIVLEQQGQTLPIVLILMLIGGLLVVPTLNYASSSLKVKQVTEKKTLELYAADAGVEEALSYLSQLAGNWSDGTPAPPDVGPYAAEKLTGQGPTTKYCYQRDEPLAINDKTVDGVDVTVERNVELQYYNITSNATSADGSSTTVTSYVEFVDFSCLFDYLVTTSGNVNTDEGHAENITGRDPDAENYTGPWPEADYLERHYWGEVTASPSFDYLDVGVDDTIPVEGLYSDVDEGEKFVIKNDTGDADDVLMLEGTVYIAGAGDLQLGRAGAGTHPFTVNLNKQTIFVEGGITIGGECTSFSGSGCIIAEGAINVAPGTDFDPDGFVFIMSVTDEVEIWPNPGFYGAIASPGDVRLHSGHGTFNHTSPPLDDEDNIDLNFLLGGTEAPITILSWQIS